MTWSKERRHNIDVTITTIASQITSLTLVYAIILSGTDQRKHQSSASLAFVGGIHQGISRTKGQLVGKCFHLMTLSWYIYAVSGYRPMPYKGHMADTNDDDMFFRRNWEARNGYSDLDMYHAGIGYWRFPLKRVAGKPFPAFPAHAQSVILRIW